jgi:phospholipase C
MPEISRRRLLGGLAAATGGAAALSLLPPNLRRVAAAQPSKGSIKDIKHVVVIMQENRSFDHLFGTLGGVRGFGDPNAITLSTGKSVFYQPDPQNPDGYLLPWHLDTKATSSQAIPSTSHAWTVQHSAWNGGKMDNWLPAHLAADGAAHGPYTMSYYERADIPFHFALAESFTLCDGYHCSLLGPTWPNRLYLMSANVDPEGTNGGPIISNVVPSPYTWSTYPERLQAAGVSWKLYQEEDDYGTNVLEFFKQYQDAAPGSPLYEKALTIAPYGQFENDARLGNLPTVSWIVPTSYQSEHPAYTPAASANYLATKLEAIASNPELWESTVVVLNYDENDGIFDHVPPPVPPAGTAGEFIDGLPIGGGIRVPCVIISPWTVGGWVASETFDHTSVLQFLEQVTGVTEPNMTAWRRQTFGDLTSALGFSPVRRPFPPLPPTIGEFWQSEYEITNLPAATVPGASQTPPVQEKTRPRVTTAAPAQAAPSGAPGPNPILGTASRLQETFTTARSDFAAGWKGMSFPGTLAAVLNQPVQSPTATHAYVPGVCGGAVAVIDTTTYALVSAIESETNPYGIAATPDGSKIYVTNSGTNVISVIDPSTAKITGSITTGIFPHGIAVSPNGSQAYVANTGPDSGPGGSSSVTVIDVASGTVAGQIAVGEGPMKIAFSPDGTLAYVTCAQGVSIIDTAHGRSRPAAPQLTQPHGVAISPNGASAYVVDSLENRVVVLDAKTGTPRATIPVGLMPWNVAFSSDGTHAYVTNANSDTVSVIDTRTQRVIATVAVGHIPVGIAYNQGMVWVAANTSSTVSVINASNNQVVQTIDIGLSDEPTEIAFA